MGITYFLKRSSYLVFVFVGLSACHDSKELKDSYARTLSGPLDKTQGALLEKIRALITQKSEVLEKITELNNQIDSTTSGYDELKKTRELQLNALENQKEELDKKVKALNIKYQDAKSKMEDYLKKLVGEEGGNLDDVTVSDKDGKPKKYSDLSEDDKHKFLLLKIEEATGLAKKISELDQEYSELEGKNTALQQSYDALKVEVDKFIEDTNASLNTIELTVTSKTQEIQSHENEMKGQKDSVVNSIINWMNTIWDDNPAFSKLGDGKKLAIIKTIDPKNKALQEVTDKDAAIEIFEGMKDDK